MQKKIDILTDLISKSALKPTQKQLAYDCLGEIVMRFNILEDKYQKRIKSDNSIKSDFTDYFDRIVTVSRLLGVSEQDLFSLKYKYSNWILSNISEIKRQLTFYDLKQMFFYLEMYENCYDSKMPEDLSELKKFILEPLSISEENFNEALKNALIELKNTGKVSEIIKLGWFKNLCGNIKTSYLCQ